MITKANGHVELFDAAFLQILRDIAVVIGVLYAPIPFVNGIMDIVLTFRNLSNHER